MKWFENTEKDHDILVGSRIRLVRNIKGRSFSWKLEEAELEGLTNDLQAKLADLGEADGRVYDYLDIGHIPIHEKLALRERHMINQSMAGKASCGGILLSRDETVSVSIGGDDHLRIQCTSGNPDLVELYHEADRIDDYINERIDYAFDEKYGYLTPFPTNVGTGMKASVIIHLPFLASGRQFNNLVDEIGRVGIKIRGLLDNRSENYGSVYELYNQNTLGQSEDDIIETVSKMAYQLAVNERKVRTIAMRDHRIDLEDEIYKSFGVLKYARKLTLKEGMIYLSYLRTGLSEGLIRSSSRINLFGCMLAIQPANLKLIKKKDLSSLEEGIARAEYLRENLPDISPVSFNR